MFRKNDTWPWAFIKKTSFTAVVLDYKINSQGKSHLVTVFVYIECITKVVRKYVGIKAPAQCSLEAPMSS